MVFEGREIDKDAAQLKGRNLIADGFLRSGYSAEHDLPDPFDNWARLGSDGGCIIVYAFEFAALPSRVKAFIYYVEQDQPRLGKIRTQPGECLSCKIAV